MRLEYLSKEKLNFYLKAVVRKYLDTREYSGFIFGSRVLDLGDERSDIDFGIEGPSAVPGDVMAKIRSEIEEIPVLYKVDVVDFGKVDPEFSKLAKRKVEYLWRN